MNNNRNAVRTIHNALIEKGASVQAYPNLMIITVDGTRYVLTEDK